MPGEEGSEGQLAGRIGGPTCQQQPVLRDPLNWLQQVMLQGQAGTPGAHLKGESIHSKPTVFSAAKSAG